MGALSVIVKHGSDLAEYDFDKIKETFVEQIGRGVSFRQTYKFFARNQVVGSEEWSKQEKNLFVHTVQDHPYKEEIIDKYNDMAMYGDVMEDKIKTFKMLASVSPFLEASQYSKPEFAQKVSEKIIEWGYLDNFENMKNLKKALHLNMDTPTLEGLLSDKIQEVHHTLSHIETKANIAKQKEKSLLRTSLAGLASFALFQYVTPTASLTGAAVAKIGAVIGSNPTVFTMVGVAVAGWAIYKTFGALNKFATGVVQKRREKKIDKVEPTDWSGTLFKYNLSNAVIGNYITSSTLDANEHNNQAYLAMSGFVNEKIFNPHAKIPMALAQRLQLTLTQVEKINSLTLEDIHEASHIHSPQLRQHFYLNHLTPTAKDLIKRVSNLQELENFKPQENAWFKNPEICNATDELKNRVDALSPIERDLALSYLALRTKNGLCSKQFMNVIMEATDPAGSMAGPLAAQLDVDFDNKRKEPPKDLEVHYFKKLYSRLMGKEDLGEPRSDMKKELNEIAFKYGFNDLNRLTFKNPSLTEQIFRFIPFTPENSDYRHKLQKYRQEKTVMETADLANTSFIAAQRARAKIS